MSNKRGMSATLETETEHAASAFYECVKITLPSQTYLLTNAPYNINFDGSVYQSIGTLMAFDEIEENATLELQKINITVSGILSFEDSNLKPIEQFLQLDYTNAPVEIHRVYQQRNDAGIDGFTIFKGFISSASFALNSLEYATVNIEVSNHLSDFDKEAGRYTNSSSQGRYYPGDLGFEFAGEVQKELKWKA